MSGLSASRRGALSGDLRERAERSLVIIGDDEAFGMGFVCGHQRIITAAHCARKWIGDAAGLDPADKRFAPVRSPGDKTGGAVALVDFYEPFTDIAVLSYEPVGVEPRDKATEDLFLERGRLTVDLAVPSVAGIRRHNKEISRTGRRNDFAIEVKVAVPTHTRQRLYGTAHTAGPSLYTFFARLDNGHIECGTSGAPVLDEEGKVVGVVSLGELFIRPALALPPWLTLRLPMEQAALGPKG